MAGFGPEAGLNKLAAVCWIAAEARFLEVGGDLDGETEEPEGATDERERRGEGGIGEGEGGEDGGEGEGDPQALESPCHQKARKGGFDLVETAILPGPADAHKQEERQAQGPCEYHCDEEPVGRLERRRECCGQEGYCDERAAPDQVVKVLILEAKCGDKGEPLNSEGEQDGVGGIGEGGLPVANDCGEGATEGDEYRQGKPCDLGIALRIGGIGTGCRIGFQHPQTMPLGPLESNVPLMKNQTTECAMAPQWGHAAIAISIWIQREPIWRRTKW